jgi:ABC-type transport system involved in cytochrome c biogenesis ATPase subunit
VVAKSPRLAEGCSPSNRGAGIIERLRSPDGSSSVAITLISLGKLQNVNRLNSDQTLSFGPGPGLTVIYGDNGAGKSSYARVIKKACRCRGQAAPILPDCRATAPSGPATATFAIRHGQANAEVIWQEGMPIDERLGKIFVFDASCADHYIHEDDGTAFVPFGLDLLEKLVRTYASVKQRLTSRLQQLTREVDSARQSWPKSSATGVGFLLAGIKATTSSDPIHKASKWSDVDERRMAEVQSLLAADSRTQADRTRAAAARVARFRTIIHTVEEGVNDQSVRKLQSSIGREVEASQAERELANRSFGGAFLSGTGGDLWRVMWQAARQFSTIDAYPNRDYPPIDGDARCVLCQTPLDDESTERLGQFDSYVSQTITDHAQTMREAVQQQRAMLLSISNVSAHYKEVFTDLGILDAAELSAITAGVDQLENRRMVLSRVVEQGEWTDVPACPASIQPMLATLVARLESKATRELEASDPVVQSQLREELAELKDRLWLSTSKSEVLSVIDKLKAIKKLEECIDETSTISVTKKSKELSAIHITKAFFDRFSEEMKFLGIHSLQVELQTRGERGSTRMGVRLQGLPSHKLSQIASEGERRCVALALFFAELSQAAEASPLVFDDPVSSLDHARRARIAERLAKESEVRQVIVFTHDLAFIDDFHHYVGSPRLHGRHIDWGGGAPGRCHNQFPWKAQKFNERMKKLREDSRKATRIHTEKGQLEYEQFAGQLIDSLRYTAESIVEDVFFEGVLRRHDRQIKMGNLERIGAVEYEDYQGVHAVWQECSRIIPGHAQSRAQSLVIPPPDQIASLVANLEEIVRRVKLRRDGASQSVEPTKLGLAGGSKGL